jgi:hypothetical protein
LATRAVYSFSGFLSTPERHLYIHHDGYPTGAAWRFATALRHSHEASSFLSSFLSTQPRADALTSAEQSADAEFRYQVRLLDSTESRLQVTCWRRLPGGTSWQTRCGPMAMAVFIQRFLPGELP